MYGGGGQGPLNFKWTVIFNGIDTEIFVMATDSMTEKYFCDFYFDKAIMTIGFLIKNLRISTKLLFL